MILFKFNGKVSFEVNAGYDRVGRDPNTGGLHGNDLNEEQKRVFAECRGSGNEIRMLKRKVGSDIVGKHIIVGHNNTLELCFCGRVEVVLAIQRPGTHD